MNSPRVTVLMSVYNGARFLREAVDSILAQTMPDFEFLIIDDGSTDETPSILASYRDLRIRVIRQENQGLAAALNHGLRLATTELVARMDADDIAVPERLELQLAAYERLGHPDVLGGAIQVIAESGRPIGVRRPPPSHSEIVRHLEAGGGATFYHPTVLYDRRSVLGIGGYDEYFRYSTEDHDLWLRLSRRHRLANSREVVVKLRLNQAGMESRAASSSVPERSAAWYRCLAKQKHLLAIEGHEELWQDSASRATIIDLLWPRFLASGAFPVARAGKSLQLARAHLRAPGMRWSGLLCAGRQLAREPSATLQYVLRRRATEPSYLSASQVLSCFP